MDTPPPYQKSSHRTEATNEHSRPLATLWRRWPIALAGLVGYLTISGEDVADAVTQILPLLALEYLIVAKLGRRGATWPIIGAMFALTFVLMAQDAVPPSAVFAALAATILVWSVLDRQLFRDGEFQAQAVGMLGFGAIALIGLAVDSESARYVVAAGWLLHGVWDLVYLWRDRVVPRSYAEWCGVLDGLVAYGLVFLV